MMNLMTKLNIVSAVFFLLLAGQPASAQDAAPRRLAFYELPLVTGKADADGRLPESVWQTVPASEHFYVYLKTEAIPGELKSSLQMAYDEKGIYLKVTNHEERMDKIKANTKTRGNPNLWHDDCVEIYFDPNGNGVGYMAFTINSLGVQTDRKQQDAAVSLDEWRGENWRVWPSRKENAWVLEAFFPFSDFGTEARAGNLWMFDLVRFAYTSGKFQGTTWSLGGNYNAPGYFGYLYFGGEKKTSVETVTAALDALAPPPWVAAVGDKILRRGGNQPLEILTPGDVKKKTVEQAEDVFSKLKPFYKNNSALEEEIAKLKQRGHELKFGTPDEALDAIGTMAGITDEAMRIYWNESLQLLIEKAGK